MLRAVEFSHHLLRERLYPGDMAIDATAGNGHDTHFLAQLTGDTGMVYSFDVQGEAISATRQLLERWGVPSGSWHLVHAGHETMLSAVPVRWHGHAGAVLFNLGYLPGSDKSIVTQTETTLAAMKSALTMLRPNGILVAVLYTGHPGGMSEAQSVRDFSTGLSGREFHTIEYRTLNVRQPSPSVLAIEKLGGSHEPEYII